MLNPVDYHLHWRKISAGAALTVLSLGAFAAPVYSVIPLTSGTDGVSINSQGQVAVQNGNNRTSTLWSDGNSSFINPPPVSGSPRFATVLSVNSSGSVVGNFTHNDTVIVSHAFAGAPANTRSLRPTNDPRFGTAISSVARSLNDSGEIVGSASFSFGGPGLPIVWRGDTYTVLPGLSPSGVGGANAISNTGLIVGEAFSPSSQWQAVLWQGNQITQLGTLGGSHSNAQDVNDLGVIVGKSSDSNNRTTAFYRNSFGEMVNLGVLGTGDYSEAYAVNNFGVAVGSSRIIPSFRGLQERAFISFDGRRISDLNEFLDSSGQGWILHRAYDINDRGQIVGGGTYNGQRMGFLLSPVPEPGTCAMLLAGLLLLAQFARGKGKPQARDQHPAQATRLREAL